MCERHENTTTPAVCIYEYMICWIIIVMTKICLSQQKYACHYKIMFVLTNMCLLWQNFWNDKYLSQQIILSWQKFCCDKHTFVTTIEQTRVCHDKTCLLPWQKYACHDRIMFVMTNICLNKCFVRRKDFCRNKSFVMTNACFLESKTFVMTKMIL